MWRVFTWTLKLSGRVHRVSSATRPQTRYTSFIFHYSLFVLQECERCMSPAPASGNLSVSEGLHLRPFVAAARLVCALHRNALFFSLCWLFNYCDHIIIFLLLLVLMWLLLPLLLKSSYIFIKWTGTIFIVILFICRLVIIIFIIALLLLLLLL